MPEGAYTDGPLEKEFSVTGDGQTLSFTFVNILYGKICVLKLDNFEEPWSGVLMTLYIWDDELGESGDWAWYAEEETGEDGKACFDELKVGLYKVVEEMPEGAYTDGPLEKEFSVTGDGQTLSFTFVNILYGKICVLKLEYGTETPIEGVLIKLYIWDDELGESGDWAWYAEEETGEDGKACFDELKVGLYKVVEELSADWYPEVSDTSDNIEVIGDGAIKDWTFTNIMYGKICGYKFFDANVNKMFDMDTETGIPNWEIQLWQDGEKIATAYTDENGHFCFIDLKLGTYEVREVMQEGWINITSTFVIVVGDTSGFEIGADFGNVVCGPPGHTIGFWKNNIIKNLNNWNGIQVPMEDLRQYLQNINDTYGGAPGFEWLMFDANQNGYVDNDEMMAAYIILSIPDASNMMLKAQAQLLSLLLTQQLWEYSDEMLYLPDLGVGTEPMVMTMQEAIDYLLWLYDQGEYAAAQMLADYLNNLPDSCVWREYLYT
jgi:hypothetical protein